VRLYVPLQNAFTRLCNSFFAFIWNLLSPPPVVSQKKSSQLNLRLTPEEASFYMALAEESGLSLSEIIRRLMRAARDCFNECDGWPREIAVVQKSRAGANKQPPSISSTYGTQADKTTCSLPPKNAYAEAKVDTKRTPKAISL
jgi:hypothetical protein